MKTNVKPLLYWLPSLAWAALIFFLSTLQPSGKPPPWFLSNDKIVHGTVFCILSCLLFVSFYKGNQLTPARSALLAFLIASAYGLTDELHQLFEAGRSSDPLDWVADTIGASLILLFVYLFRSKIRVHSRPFAVENS